MKILYTDLLEYMPGTFHNVNLLFCQIPLPFLRSHMASENPATSHTIAMYYSGAPVSLSLMD